MQTPRSEINPNAIFADSFMAPPARKIRLRAQILVSQEVKGSVLLSINEDQSIKSLMREVERCYQHCFKSKIKCQQVFFEKDNFAVADYFTVGDVFTDNAYMFVVADEEVIKKRDIKAKDKQDVSKNLTEYFAGAATVTSSSQEEEKKKTNQQKKTKTEPAKVEESSPEKVTIDLKQQQKKDRNLKKKEKKKEQAKQKQKDSQVKAAKASELKNKPK